MLNRLRQVAVFQEGRRRPHRDAVPAVPERNVEIYQDAINKKYGTTYKIPVMFYNQLMAVAFGMDAKADAYLDRNTIRSEKLENLAKKG